VDLSRLLCRKCDYQQNPGRVLQGIPGFLVPALQETFNHLNALPSSLTGIPFSFCFLKAEPVNPATAIHYPFCTPGLTG
jgi:hypothetical protein